MSGSPNTRLVRKIVLYALLSVVAFVILFPLLYAFVVSFMTQAEAAQYPPKFFPSGLNFDNYRAVLERLPIPRYILNSFIVAGSVMIAQLVTASLAAYAFAVREFRGRTALFMLFLATLMIPFEVTLIPNFVTIRHFPLLGGNDFFGNGGKGLYNTYAGMILPGAASGFSVFLLRQAFMTIPREYWEAAQIDGCSRPYFLWRVLVPLAMPAISTVALFALLARFNALLWPLVITGSEKLRPVQVGIYYFRSGEASYLNLVMAASAFVMLPAIVLYAFTQRRFVEGLASTGIKG